MSGKGNFCAVGSFEPSYRTKLAIKEMNHVVDMSGYLATLISMVPIFQVFAGHSTYASADFLNKGYQVSSQDWNLFSDALKSIGLVKREKLAQIANLAETYTTGEESKFWRCVYNAL
ncbi:hypothetical protein [Shewanella marina]|uniref:hypothetical protein n=1 Tax=Shewanella marina TaxID=487319 RepID=UPI00056C4F45|nr:hypothetical protein [Shewanella marina]